MNFPYPELLTTPEKLAERLEDPTEGLAMIETGYDPGPLMRKVADKAEEIRGDRFRNRSVFFIFSSLGIEVIEHPGAQHAEDLPEELESSFIEHVGTEEMKQVYLITNCIRESCFNSLSPEKGYPFKQRAPNVLVNLANRMRGGINGHSDEFSDLTIWFGATQPGLVIMHPKRGTLHIPGAPAGYGLIWRGQEFAGDSMATRHTVRYRGSVPRVSLLS